MQAKEPKNWYVKENSGDDALRPFELDQRLERDSKPLVTLELCQVRLMNDQRWPWVILVPQRPGISEAFELTPLDQAILTFEQMTVASALKASTSALKINIGALGNMVRQLHIHVIARNEGDANWPGPVWGFGTPEAYSSDVERGFRQRFMEALNR